MSVIRTLGRSHAYKRRIGEHHSPDTWRKPCNGFIECFPYTRTDV